MSEPTVLVYHMDRVRLLALAQMSRAMNVRLVEVEETEYRAPIGLLTGNADMAALAAGAGELMNMDARPVDEEMIVMASFPEDLFYSFLQELHDMNLLIGLKAVETENNQSWSGEILQTELKRERAAFLKAKDEQS